MFYILSYVLITILLTLYLILSIIVEIENQEDVFIDSITWQVPYHPGRSSSRNPQVLLKVFEVLLLAKDLFSAYPVKENLGRTFPQM